MPKNAKYHVSSKSTPLEQIVEKIIELRSTVDTQLINKFSIEWLIHELDEQKLHFLEQKFCEFDKKGVDVINFVMIFLQMINHQEHETLYITIGLIDMFKELAENNDQTNYVKYTDVTWMLVDWVVEKDNRTYMIPQKLMPKKTYFQYDSQKIRKIDVFAPLIHGKHTQNIKKINPNKIIPDSLGHNNEQVAVAVYAGGINRLLSLDALGNKISVFDMKCVHQKNIFPKIEGANEIRETIIMGFAWSEQQMRIGCCMKDFTMSFWDANDILAVGGSSVFEKQFLISTSVNDFQSKIWFVDYLNAWITTDKSTNDLHSWDIEEECLIKTLVQPKQNGKKGEIIDLIGIEVVKLLIVATTNRRLHVYNYFTNQIVVDFGRNTFQDGGVYSLAYSESYKVLFTAGYKKYIQCWDINPLFHDSTLLGKLIGHRSLVSAITVVEQTPMCLSADDSGSIKVWDIRSLQCIQTVDLQSKARISRLISLMNHGMVCFISNRVNLLEFDEKKEIIQKFKQEEQQYPIHVEFSQINDELVLSTNKDVRFIDIKNGRTKKIYSGLTKEGEDITIFKVVQQNKKFIIGNEKGSVDLFSYTTGDQIRKLIPHTNEVSGIKIDYTNKLYLSISWDSTIHIQKEKQSLQEKERNKKSLRSVKNAHYNKEIQLVELSVYHNVFVTAANINFIYIYDYEFVRLLGRIQLDDIEDPTCMAFINGYSILMIGTNQGNFYFIHFEKTSQKLNFQLIGLINLNSEVDKQQKKAGWKPPAFDTQASKQMKEVPAFGKVKPKQNKTPQTMPPKTFQPGRKRRMAFFNQDSFKIDQNMQVQLQDEYEEVNMNFTQSYERSKERRKQKIKDTSFQKKKKIFATKILIDFKINDEGYADVKDQQPESCLIFLSTNTGEIRSYDIMNLFTDLDFQLQVVKPESKRPNYNPQRINHQDFLISINNSKATQFILKHPLDRKHGSFLTLNSEIQRSWDAHSEQLTALAFIEVPEKLIITSSSDKYLKIFNLKGDILGALNINHPLPIQWNIVMKKSQRARKKVLYSLKILELIAKRKKKTYKIGDNKAFNINNFLSELNQVQVGQIYNPGKQASLIDPLQQPKLKKVDLMIHEFDKRDFQIKKTKTMFKSQLQGPSLKQMEALKRIKEANLE